MGYTDLVCAHKSLLLQARMYHNRGEKESVPRNWLLSAAALYTNFKGGVNETVTRVSSHTSAQVFPLYFLQSFCVVKQVK